ncbi:MAG: hypothetical protein ABI091_28395 [Ferruginibacter sp.]
MATPLIPGYEIHDYKLVLVPHEDLAKKIIQVQKDFNEKFKIESQAVFMPQLLLAKFTQIKAVEERLLNRLKIVAMGHHAVKVELKDFGSFPSHMIFINVTSKGPITELVKKIRQDTQRLMKLDADHKPHFMTDANIILGAKLKPWQYENAWNEYSHHHFTGRFIASKMLLLRKKPDEYKYKPLENFDFMNLPIETKQGELFNF